MATASVQPWNANTWRAPVTNKQAYGQPVNNNNMMYANQYTTQPVKPGQMTPAVQPQQSLFGATLTTGQRTANPNYNATGRVTVQPQPSIFGAQTATRGGRPLPPANPANPTTPDPAAGRPGAPTETPGAPESPVFKPPANGNPAAPWDYTVPTPGAMTPGQLAAWQQYGSGSMTQDEWNWYGANANDIATWLQMAQYNQNNYQYSMDFNEAQRRYNQEFGWQQQQDQYNMGLAGRQQEMAEWQANEAARQWQEQFGYTQKRDAQEFQLANDQLAVERAYRAGLISNEQRNLALQELTQQQNNQIQQGQLQFSRDELAALQQWRNTEAGLRQQEMENANLQSRYAAFGRAQAPGQGKFLRNW